MIPPDQVSPEAAILMEFRSAAGGARRSALRTLHAEGEQTTYGTRIVHRWWGLAIRNKGYQTGRWRRAASGEPRFEGAPSVFGISGRLGWLSGTNMRMYQPYVAPGTMGPRNPEETMARREVLWAMMGVVPDWLQEDGVVVFSSPEKTRVDTTPALRLEVADRDGTVGRLYFDAGTHLPLAYEYRIVSRPSGQEYWWNITYRDYHMVDGIVVPRTMGRISSDTPVGQGSTIRLASWAVNAAVDDVLVRPNASDPVSRVPPGK